MSTVAHPARVIFMHGLGDTPSGWADTLRSTFSARVPHVSWALPAAPKAPVTCNGGMVMNSWMDLHEIPVEPGAHDDEAGIGRSVSTVHRAIDEAVASGIPAERIVVAGFSQGAAMAFISTLRYPKKLGGCVILSGWPPLINKEPIALSANAKTEFFIAHGLSDNVVTAECAQLTGEGLSAAGVPARMRLYPGMAHSSCDKEMQDLGEFLAEVLA
ncbi:protein ATH-1 [Pavlovales sp. CCMP2436]|nr:protein ATH-1 [Pavlovales sp. CCMP2436]